MTANPPPPDPPYGERALYQEAMRAYPGRVAFARWLRDSAPGGGGRSARPGRRLAGWPGFPHGALQFVAVSG